MPPRLEACRRDRRVGHPPVLRTMTKRPVRILICYPLINGYMAACWRELASRPGIDLKVVGHAPGRDDLVAFTHDVMDGIPSRLLTADERDDEALTRDIATEFDPDLMIISGWSHRPFRKLYGHADLKSAAKVLVMDNQIRRDWRQFAGKLLLKPLLRNVDMVFVTGERSLQLARYWGVGEARIRTGAVSVDHRALAPLHHARMADGADGWPRAFLFVGRYHHRKAIDVLVAAYRKYRDSVTDPWPLLTAGMGPEAARLKGVEGIEDLGFVHPSDMPDVWQRAGVFVLPSRYDAWPLVNVEAAASGLPVLCTQTCGSHVETVGHSYSGLVVETGSSDAFRAGLHWFHDRHEMLPEFGRRGQQLAARYSAQVWADRVEDIVASVL